MIDHNHPAVEAANLGVQEWLAGPGPFDDDPARLAGDMTAVCVSAALEHLESATEENIARLRDTPAGRALMAEGWEDGAQAAWGVSGEGWNGEYAGRPGPSGVFRAQNPTFPNPHLEGNA